ncbi:MAG: transglutaminase-like domain-containing protein [Acidimicrobiales bacterium]
MVSVAEELNARCVDPGARLDLIMAAIATLDHDAAPDAAELVAELDQLAAPLGTSAEVADVMAYVFGELAFVGDTSGYHRAVNSYLHRVLERRRGIPITLAAVTAEIGRRAGVELSVVGLPGHVVLGDGDSPRRWFDPFAGGAELDRPACEALVARLDNRIALTAAMLAPIDPRAFASRMLNNLKVAQAQTGNLAGLIDAVTVSSELRWSPPSELAELARFLGVAGRHDQAAAARTRLIQLEPDRADAHRAAARRHLAHRN